MKDYQFQKTLFPWMRNKGKKDPQKIAGDLEAFLCNLGVKEDTDKQVNIESDMRALLTEFVKHHQSNILYYKNAISWEIIYKYLYFAVSAILLFAVPVLLYLDKEQQTPVGAQVSAILVGIIGFHRLLSHFLESRSYAVIFHQASSSLKASLYDFEETWKGRARCVRENEPDTGQLVSLREALKASIAAAKEIVRNEENSYFTARLTIRPVDLGEMLSTSRGTVDTLKMPYNERQFERRQTRLDDLDDLLQEESKLSAKLDTINAQLAELKSALVNTTDAGEVTELNKTISEQNTKKLEVGLELNETRAAINSLRLRLSPP